MGATISLLGRGCGALGAERENKTSERLFRPFCPLLDPPRFGNSHSTFITYTLLLLLLYLLFFFFAAPGESTARKASAGMLTGPACTERRFFPSFCFSSSFFLREMSPP